MRTTAPLPLDDDDVLDMTDETAEAQEERLPAWGQLLQGVGWALPSR
jgi:hypothetical protein